MVIISSKIYSILKKQKGKDGMKIRLIVEDEGYKDEFPAIVGEIVAEDVVTLSGMLDLFNKFVRLCGFVPRGDIIIDEFEDSRQLIDDIIED